MGGSPRGFLAPPPDDGEGGGRRVTAARPTPERDYAGRRPTVSPPRPARSAATGDRRSRGRATGGHGTSRARELAGRGPRGPTTSCSASREPQLISFSAYSAYQRLRS